MTLGSVSYGLGGLMFLALTALLSSSWRGERSGFMLILACALTSIWCGVLAYGAIAEDVTWAVGLVAENLRNGAWLLFLTSVLGLSSGARFRRFMYFATHLLWAGMLTITAAKATGLDWGLLTLVTGKAVLLGQLAVALVGIILIEQLYRNTSSDNKWSVKYLCLGAGAVFVYDLVLYANAYLFLQISEPLWQARGLATSFAVPLLAISARRNPHWSLDIFVSRQVVFYGGSLTAVGLYLVAMAAGGYYIRGFGGSWGGFVQTLFLFLAVLMLLVVVLSGDVRARIRVFISKHFYRNKYEYREEWLRLNDILASTNDERTLKGRAIVAMAQIIGSNGGLLLQERDGYFYVSLGWQMEGSGDIKEPRDSKFVQLLEKDHWVVDSSQERPVPDGSGGLPAWVPGLSRHVLIVPLLNGSTLQGMMVVKWPEAPFSLTYEDIDLLRTVGRQIAGHLAQHALDEQLAENRQFDAYNRLTSFLMHDLKNVIAQQSMVVKNAARHKDNPEFIEDAIKTIDNSVQRMQRLLQQLKAGALPPTGGKSNVADVLHNIESEWRGQCRLEVSVGDRNAWTRASAERLSMILRHIIKNAEDASQPGQLIRVTLHVAENEISISVEDYGTGMDAMFVRDQLFKPFVSTKGSQGMGIGAYQVREFVRELGGEVKVRSQPGKGTLLLVTLPKLRKND